MLAALWMLAEPATPESPVSGVSGFGIAELLIVGLPAIAIVVGAFLWGRASGKASVLAKAPAQARCSCGAVRACPNGHDR